MSVRASDAFEAGSKFSLRDVVQQSQTNPTSIVVPAPGLKFNLNGLKAETSPAAAAPVAALPKLALNGLSLRFDAPQAPATPKAVQAPPPLAPTPSKAPEPPPPRRPLFSMRQQASTSDTMQSNVMRLTAYVDDLDKRLQRTQNKLENTELQLARTSQQLCAERQTAGAKVEVFKADLASAHETESKLRAELASRPAKTSLNESAFSAAVSGVLLEEDRTDKLNRQSTELEMKIQGLGEAKVQLEAEINKLTELRGAAKLEMEQIQASSEELQALSKEARMELQKNQEELTAVETRLAIANEQVATAEAAIDTAKASAVAAQVDAEAVAADAMASASETAAKAAELASKAEEEAAVKVALAMESASETAAKAAETAAKAEEAAATKAALADEAASRLSEEATLRQERAKVAIARALELEAEAKARVEAVLPPKLVEGLEGDEAATALESVPETTAPAVNLMDLDTELPAQSATVACCCPEAADGSEASEASESPKVATEAPAMGAPESPPRAPPSATASESYEPPSLVTGALAPDNDLSFPPYGGGMWHSLRRMPHNNVALLTHLDAPADLTFHDVSSQFFQTKTTGDATAKQNAMVHAVILDLQGYLMQNIAATPATGIAAPLV